MNEDEIDALDAKGHRERLRKRLLTNGPDTLLDHEVVEFLLTLVIPRVDTKPRAKELIRELGGIGPLLSADVETLLRAGLSEREVSAIKIAEASALRMLKSEVLKRPVLSSWQALIDYLTADMAHWSIERVRVLHLNGKNALIRDELVSEGSIDQAAVYVREVIRRALDLGSAALILVHNHPSGDPSPSKQDIDLTKQISLAGKPMGIVVHDHIIIGQNGHSSLRSLGLI
jgi:DNA repair protein RadC